MKVPDVASKFTIRVGGDERARTRFYKYDLPPLFEISSATRVLALMAHVGPLGAHHIDKLEPRVPGKRTTDVLNRYVEAGLLITFIVKELNGQPRVWGFNRAHQNFDAFDKLCKALWKHHVSKIITTVPYTPYRIPIESRKKAKGGLLILHRGSFKHYGEILHLLAEFHAPVEQSIVRRKLDRDGTKFCHQVSSLVAQGLVSEEYKGVDRMIELNAANPIMPELRRWLHYVNRTSEKRFGEIADLYREEYLKGYHVVALRRWRLAKKRGLPTPRRGRQPRKNRSGGAPAIDVQPAARS